VTAAQIVFLIAAGITLVSALMVVTLRRVMQSALALILALMGVSVVFAVLGSGFFAVAQVIVYIGAIAILIIFTVMLTQRSMEADDSQLNRGAIPAAVGIIVLLTAALFALSAWSGFQTLPVDVPAGTGSIAEMGRLLTDPQGYALPFEAVSVLLVAALVGAVYVARDQKKDE